jgi:hypothetical protein
MSELDSGLTELRDDLRATINRPDLGQVAGRARQRSVRQRMQLGAIAAVVAVSVTVPVLRSVPDGPADLPVTPDYHYQVDFADADHGYALGSDCEPGGSCSFTLLATEDGGRSWEPRTVPKDGGPYREGSVSVFGPSRVTFTFVRSTSDTIAQFVSEDAGRTWRAFEVWGVGASSPIPSGASLMHICRDSSSECLSGAGVMSSDRGELLPTPAQPPLGGPLLVGRVATAGGRYWMAGTHEASGRWAIAVTSDAGRTWATTEVDVPGKASSESGEAWSVVEQGDVMYATVRGAIGSGPFGLLAVFRSTDQGMSWTRTWYATPTEGLQGLAGSPIATADGRLIVYSTVDGPFESSDGGQTFTRSSLPLPGKVVWTRAGYLVLRPETGYDLSSDGLDWRTFTLP